MSAGSGTGFGSGSQSGSNRGPWPTWVRAAVITVGFIAVLWVIQGINSVDHQRLDSHGIEPRSREGLLGIVLAPLLHASWEHVEGNSAAIVVLMFLVLVSGIGRGLVVTTLVWVVSGLGVWLVSPTYSVTVGASGLVFGWLVYLLVRGFVTRQVLQIVLGVVVLVGYGSILLGALPGTPGVSWQAHLFGAVGGLLAAVLLLDRDGGRHTPLR